MGINLANHAIFCTFGTFAITFANLGNPLEAPLKILITSKIFLRVEKAALQDTLIL
jgi:hypothetical protein